MKTQFVTDDGKVFATAEAAKAHEDTTRANNEKVKQYVKRIEEIDMQVEKLEEERTKILAEWKKSRPESTQKSIDTINSLYNLLFGDGRE